jgi:hypothetical protein
MQHDITEGFVNMKIARMGQRPHGRCCGIQTNGRVLCHKQTCRLREIKKGKKPSAPVRTIRNGRNEALKQKRGKQAQARAGSSTRSASAP